MLYIKFGSVNWDSMTNEYIHDIDGYFDGFHEDSWTTSSWSKRVVTEIDKSTIITPKIVDSPFLGNIRIEDISGGAKMLIMCDMHQDVVYDGDNLGDNCWPLFLELCRYRDIQITLSYYPRFEWPANCVATIIDDGAIVHNLDEFTNSHMLYRGNRRMDFQQIKWPLPINKGVFDIEFDF